MIFLSLSSAYLGWHYSRAFRDLYGIWINYLWYIGNLFSIATLVRTLLMPLKLMEEPKGNLFADPTHYAENLLVNVIMRIVGAVARLVLIIVALILWTIMVVLGALCFLLWFVLPVLLLLMIVWGVIFLFS